MSTNALTPVLPVDPQQIDETGMPWVLLSRATDPTAVRPGRVLVVGPRQDPLLARVIDLQPLAEDQLVHVEVLGSVAEVEAAIHAA